MRPEYIERLTPGERFACIKAGMVRELAGRGPEMSKSASLPEALLNLPWKIITAVSVLGGVPLGIAAHIVNNKMTEENIKEKELRQKSKYYRQATQGLESGLAEFPGAEQDEIE